MNLPNKLTILRFLLVPVFMLFLTVDAIYFAMGDTAARLTALAIFAAAAFTDFLDGQIARRCHLVTDFGKFMDPLADKLMVFGALLGIIYVSFIGGVDPLFGKVFVWAAFLVMLRELSVTSMRLVISGKSGKVIAAQWSGKLKTVTQMLCIMVCIAEPVWYGAYGKVPYLSYVFTAAMIVMTVYSGIEYFVKYMPLMDSNK
ncbi:MAG: CDP-diacylglycerol--glycerol-3-phosphate 3-phosphatidyltransferase [Clostridiales bacterium]|nr:CDP-diacylglycerol--glycerol-3-phosphate 3-phosphatidyltransferase [Clostridiales bacterium]